jgi:hypothetical protein
MGYRSDVMAAFYVKDKKHFPVLKLWLDENFPMEMFKDQINWFDRGMILEDGNTKWYADYEEVEAFDAAVHTYLKLVHNSSVEQQDVPEFCYEFVRIGENYDDIDAEYEGISCEWLLGVNREITCDVRYTNERDV